MANLKSNYPKYLLIILLSSLFFSIQCINEVEKTGSLDLTIKWDQSEIQSPLIKGKLTDSDSKTAPIEFEMADGNNKYENDAIPSGNYSLNVKLYENDQECGSASENILIYSDATTKTSVFAAKYSTPDNETSKVISVWAFPDGSIVKGNVKIGVVAYYATGISTINFKLDGVLKASVDEEKLNTSTGEYEYFLELDTTTIPDGEHKISAVIIPNPSSDTSRELSDLIIHVANNTILNTYYVDSAGNDSTGDGSSANPWKTIGRALGTQWGTQNLEPRAKGGDTVLVKPGVYDLPDDQYGTHTKYITVKSVTAGTVIVKGGALRSPFIKFEGINFSASTGSGISAYTSKAHHYWFKNCTYSGYGKIWPDTVDIDGFVRSSDDSHDVIVENCAIHDANQGISLIGNGNYIIRNNSVYNQNGDGMKFQRDNVLITGNRIYNVAPPKAWSVSKNSGPYNCDGITLAFFISTDYGSTYPASFNISLFGNNQTAAQVVSQLNANSNFASNNFIAELSANPYPHAGNIRIEKTGTETHRFYITGDTSKIFNFSDNKRALNDVSSTYPARYSTEHCDYIANDGRSSSNVVIRNNKMYGGSAQGIKLDLIGGTGYKKNIAIVNNLLAGGLNSSTMFYMNYRGSGSPASYISYYNIFFVHNTVIRPSSGFIRACISIDMNNPYLSNITIKNNIIGHYFHGDWSFSSSQGISDYNFFTDDTYGAGRGINKNSILASVPKGNANFVNVDLINNWDFRLNTNSEARGQADPSSNIKYDVDWNTRSLTAPSIGCYE